MNCAGPGHFKGGAGEAEVTAVVPGRDGGGGEVEWSGNPIGEVSDRAVAARNVRAVSGDEAAYRAEQKGHADGEGREASATRAHSVTGGGRSIFRTQ